MAAVFVVKQADVTVPRQQEVLSPIVVVVRNRCAHPDAGDAQAAFGGDILVPAGAERVEKPSGAGWSSAPLPNQVHVQKPVTVDVNESGPGANALNNV
jgi:hypothetical protein